VIKGIPTTNRTSAKAVTRVMIGRKLIGYTSDVYIASTKKA